MSMGSDEFAVCRRGFEPSQPAEFRRELFVRIATDYFIKTVTINYFAATVILASAVEGATSRRCAGQWHFFPRIANVQQFASHRCLVCLGGIYPDPPEPMTVQAAVEIVTTL